MEGRTPDFARTHTFVLAGGQGERLHPLTVSRPKPAVSFGGVYRIIDFTLANCLQSGVGDVAVITQYLHEELQGYIKHHWGERSTTKGRDAWRVTCLPPVSGRHYKGTADAVFQNLNVIQSDDKEFVLVLSGDHIYRMDYRGFLEQHIETGADLTIATVEHPIAHASHFGVVEIDGTFRITGFVEKPKRPQPMPSKSAMALVSMGIYVFRKKALESALKDLCGNHSYYDFGNHVIPALIQSGRTFAFDFRDKARDVPYYWRDIGTLDGYYNASMDFVNPRYQDQWLASHARPSGSEVPPAKPTDRSSDTAGGRPAQILRSVVSPDVFVAESAVVEDCVLMPGVRVGRGARLRRVIVEEDVSIPDGCQAGFDAEADRRQHTVTSSGVVVIGRGLITKSAVVNFAAREKTTVKKTFDPEMLPKTSAAAS